MEQRQLKTPEVRPQLDRTDLGPQAKNARLRVSARAKRIREAEEAEEEERRRAGGAPDSGPGIAVKEMARADDERSRAADTAVQALLLALNGPVNDAAGAAMTADLVRVAVASLAGLSEMTGARSGKASFRAAMAAEDIGYLRAMIGSLEAGAAAAARETREPALLS